MKKQIGIWAGGCLIDKVIDLRGENPHKAELKRQDEIRKIKRAMREKRGIIIGLTAPQDRHAELLQKTRQDLSELVERLNKLKGEKYE